jgi:hypothetical protein
MECALGVAVGLASAALARAGGASRAGVALAGGLAGTFATHLVAGYVSNLVFAVVFLAALVVLEDRSRRAVIAAAVLLGAGALAHPLFFFVGVAVLLVAGALAFRADRDQAWRAAAAALGGGAILGAGWLAMLAGPSVLRTDTSQDAFLRRAGLGENLAHAYRDRLIHRWTRYVEWASLPLAALGAAKPGGWIRRTLVAWAGVTAAGVLAGLVTTWVPPDRFITFGYAIPILAAFGLVAIVERWSGRPAAAIAIASVLAAAMLAGSGIAWLREKPYLGTGAVDAVTSAARYASATPAGTPWVFPVDSPSSKISFLATRLQNVIRAVVPPDRVADVYVIAPPPPGGLSEADGREWSALARLYAANAQAAAAGSAPVVIRIDAFDARDDARTPECAPPGRTEARSPVCQALGAPAVAVAGGVSVSGVPRGTRPLAPDNALESSTARAVAAGPLVFVVLAVAGFGWSSVVTRDAIRALALGPAFGAAAVTLGGVIADRLGLRLDGAGPGLLVLGVVTAGGYAVLLGERRRAPDAAPELDP